MQKKAQKYPTAAGVSCPIRLRGFISLFKNIFCRVHTPGLLHFLSSSELPLPVVLQHVTAGCVSSAACVSTVSSAAASMVGSGVGVSVGAAVGVGVSVAVGVGVSVGVAFFAGSAVALTETDSADASIPPPVYFLNFLQRNPLL